MDPRSRSSLAIRTRLHQPPHDSSTCHLYSTSWLIARSLPLLILCILLEGLGCGAKGPQYPEDHERFRRIDAAVEALRKAYVGKDSSALESLMLPLDPLERVQREAQNDFDNFQDIDLEFSIERILIDGENIDVFVHWQGQWKKVSTDSGLRQRGHAQLQWVGVQSILLRGVQGDLPFGIGARQTISEPPSENRKGP